MSLFSPIIGLPCDGTHPYPAPHGADWVDSMDFGAAHRVGRDRMYDRDTTPAWRAIAAYLWGAPCQAEHVETVAADSILTTYLLAASALALRDPDLDKPWLHGFSDKAARVFTALRENGPAGARAVVDDYLPPARTEMINEAVQFVNERSMALRLDAANRFTA